MKRICLLAKTYDQARRDLGTRHTLTQPGHAFTNGFVERHQGTIRHEHRWVGFRRRYRTEREVSLQSCLYLRHLQRRTDRPRLLHPRSETRI